MLNQLKKLIKFYFIHLENCCFKTKKIISYDGSNQFAIPMLRTFPISRVTSKLHNSRDSGNDFRVPDKALVPGCISTSSRIANTPHRCQTDHTSMRDH